MFAESRFDGRVGALKLKFNEMDKNNDKSLDFDELKGLLRETRPDAKDRDLKWRFQELDKGKQGKISFGEFCDFVYKDAPKSIRLQSAKRRSSVTEAIAPEVTKKQYSFPGAGAIDPEFRDRRLSDRTFETGFKGQRRGSNSVSQRRHSENVGIKAHWRMSDTEMKRRLSMPSGAEAAGIDWEATSDTFYAYAGADKKMQGGEFARLCRDCKFFDDRFSPGHGDHIFRWCCGKGKGEKALEQKTFCDALMLISQAKLEPATSIRSAVCHVLNQPTSRDSVGSVMIKSASVTGVPERPRSRNGSLGGSSNRSTLGGSSNRSSLSASSNGSLPHVAGLTRGFTAIDLDLPNRSRLNHHVMCHLDCVRGVRTAKNVRAHWAHVVGRMVPATERKAKCF